MKNQFYNDSNSYKDEERNCFNNNCKHNNCCNKCEDEERNCFNNNCKHHNCCNKCVVCPPGPQGATGTTGATGPAGATGTNGLAEYAYIYNLDAQTVNIEADILFSNNGLIVGTISHTVGTSTIQIGSAGNYAVWFYVAGIQPYQFTLFQNGVQVAGSLYGTSAGTVMTTGMVIISATAGDILTIRNHTSAFAVTLETLAGGTQINTNASVLIQKISG